MSGDLIWLSQLVGGHAAAIHVVEARDAATMTTTAIPQPPHQQKHHPPQNFNSARLRNLLQGMAKQQNGRSWSPECLWSYLVK